MNFGAILELFGHFSTVVIGFHSVGQQLVAFHSIQYLIHGVNIKVLSSLYLIAIYSRMSELAPVDIFSCDSGPLSVELCMTELSALP